MFSILKKEINSFFASPIGYLGVEPDRLGITCPERRPRTQQTRATQRVQDRLGRQHGGKHRHDHPDPERERKPPHPRVRQPEQDEGDEDRDDVGVQDRRQALLVAGRNRRSHTAARPDLLLDTLEDHDVRIGRHPEREDHPCDPRQREHDRNQLHDRVQVQPVDAHRDRGDHAEHPIEDQQEQHHDREPREPCEQAPVERLLTQRSRHLRTRHQLQPHRQRPDLQDLRQVLGRVDRERTRDLGARPTVDPVRVLDVVDRGRRDELVVEHDREMLPVRRSERVVASALGDRARDLLERFAPAVGELEPDDRLVAELLVEVLLGIANVGARQRRVVLHHPEAVGVRSAARTFWSRTTRMPSGTSTTWARSRSASSRSSSAASRVSDGWPLLSARWETSSNA